MASVGVGGGISCVGMAGCAAEVVMLMSCVCMAALALLMTILASVPPICVSSCSRPDWCIMPEPLPDWKSLKSKAIESPKLPMPPMFKNCWNSSSWDGAKAGSWFQDAASIMATLIFRAANSGSEAQIPKIPMRRNLFVGFSPPRSLSVVQIVEIVDR